MEKDKEFNTREYILDYLKGKPYTVKGEIITYVTSRFGDEETPIYEESIGRLLRVMADTELDSEIRGKLVYYRLKDSKVVEDKVAIMKRIYEAYMSLYKKHTEHTLEVDRVRVIMEKILHIESDVKVAPKTIFVRTQTGVKEVEEGYKLLEGEKFI